MLLLLPLCRGQGGGLAPGGDLGDLLADGGASGAERRTKVRPPLDSYTLRLLTKQDGACPLCGDHLLSAGQPPQSPEQWEQWWLHVTRKAIAASYLTHHGRPGSRRDDQTRLVHTSCQRELQARQRRKPEHQLQPATPSRLA